MPEHIHSRVYLEDGDVVSVDCDTQANVMLTTDTNYSCYTRGDSYNYYGGFFTHFPARIAPPHSGYWNVAIDLGGGSANIRYSINVIS